MALTNAHFLEVKWQSVTSEIEELRVIKEIKLSVKLLKQS